MRGVRDAIKASQVLPPPVDEIRARASSASFVAEEAALESSATLEQSWPGPDKERKQAPPTVEECPHPFQKAGDASTALEHVSAVHQQHLAAEASSRAPLPAAAREMVSALSAVQPASHASTQTDLQRAVQPRPDAETTNSNILAPSLPQHSVHPRRPLPFEAEVRSTTVRDPSAIPVDSLAQEQILRTQDDPAPAALLSATACAAAVPTARQHMAPLDSSSDAHDVPHKAVVRPNAQSSSHVDEADEKDFIIDLVSQPMQAVESVLATQRERERQLREHWRAAQAERNAATEAKCEIVRQLQRKTLEQQEVLQQQLLDAREEVRRTLLEPRCSRTLLLVAVRVALPLLYPSHKARTTKESEEVHRLLQVTSCSLT